MISSKALRRISARSRGLRAAQPSNAASAASRAALASSTVALATDAILRSVAGSITSKRPPSEALRHLPPIQRSVGTLARRFSYIVYLSIFPLISAQAEIQLVLKTGVPAFAGTSGIFNSPGSGARFLQCDPVPAIRRPPEYPRPAAGCAVL